jgi:hypothetical protein
MAPWWKRHQHRYVCERCQGHDAVHEGLGRKCRVRLHSEEASDQAVTGTQVPLRPMPASPNLEPLHDRPWVHRGGG